MPILIGAKPENSFDNPLGLLSDCHRRIERFLDQLLLVTEQTRGGAINPEQREALAVALRYFAQAAPLHTRDEEESLFPRLRESGSDEARAALAAVDALEADHDAADIAHAEVDALGRRWLADGTLPETDAARLADLLRALQETYRRHIAVEDNEIFPLAGRALDAAEVESVGREMVRRRGLDFDNLPIASNCRGRRLL